MDNRTYIILAVAIMAAVTALLRFLPFLIFRGGRKTPPFIAYLSKALPCAIMGMLVIYCLKDTVITDLHSLIPTVAASAAVVLSYLWKKNTLISIAGGTAVYMLLIRLI